MALSADYRERLRRNRNFEVRNQRTVIPSVAEGSRSETFKLTQRDPSACARDDCVRIAGGMIPDGGSPSC